ncbi:hypothetical protein KDL01_01020 [Actinospica durhamensis]|uniref:Uncharacterized protein n=1 Tax=Actinospica durhamensis TaxID=1508375 RepID=A0A941EMN4_9ACTN|nr:hypothetical protein [Actinospica durhamensis]MBR7831819.1 hypothetical protein [Actinospica durhamensis]
MDAFGLTQRPEVRAWPFVASVGLRTVTLRWAFGSLSTIPEPEAPWRAGHDARVWIADRAELGAQDAAAGGNGDGDGDRDGGNATLAVGWFEETVVFLSTSRAPGPIVVSGAVGQDTTLLRELIAGQSGDPEAQAPDDGGPHGAWWPVEVDRDAIMLLGLAIARMFTAEQARLACELMQGTGTAAEGRSRRTTVVEHAAETVEQVEQIPQETRDARPEDVGGAATSAPVTAPVPETVPAPAPVPVSVPEPMDAGTSVPAPAAAPAAAPAPAPAPAPAEDDLDDWAAGFAVSSAEETAHH